jgi:hypothetical protein
MGLDLPPHDTAATVPPWPRQHPDTPTGRFAGHQVQDRPRLVTHFQFHTHPLLVIARTLTVVPVDDPLTGWGSHAL